LDSELTTKWNLKLEIWHESDQYGLGVVWNRSIKLPFWDMTSRRAYAFRASSWSLKLEVNELRHSSIVFVSSVLPQFDCLSRD